MTVEEILPDLFFVQRGYLNANHFVFRGDRPVLIDTAYLPHFDQTQRIISEIGVDLARVGLIVSTHCHCDHIGGNRRIQELSGCEIALHRVGKHFIDSRDDWATWWRYYGQAADFFTCTRSLEDDDSIAVGPYYETSRRGIFAVGDVHGDIKLITVAWAEGIQAAIYAFKEITSPYWLNEKRLRDHKIALIGEKIAQAASQKPGR